MIDEIDVEGVDDEIDSQPTDAPEESLRDSLKNAFAEAKQKQQEAETAEKTGRARDANGKFAKKEENGEISQNIAENTQKTDVIKHQEANKPVNPPQSWSAAAKQRWAELPPDIQAEISKRENDIHQGFTRLDEERNFGKQLKEIITPYMPIIQAEGGNPAIAVQNLLNTAYQLRAATPQQKGAMLWEIAKQYGADMGVQSPTASYVDPQIQALEQRYANLEQQLQREKYIKEQQQQAAINTEIEAFAAKPENIHFETVKAHMAALLANGLATDLQDAYDQAVYARPDIRSSLIAEQQAQTEAKRVAEIKAKSTAARNASLSLRGAPGAAVPAAKAPERTLREELIENYRAAISN